MKQTKLMRTLSSRNCSKIFSAKINKAFDQALENGNAEIVDANNDLAVATVGNDIIVEDKINNEITKFTPNPEVEGDMVMEAIVDTPEDEAYCKSCSETEEPKATEKYENTPTVGLSSDTHEIKTVPEVEVVVNEGITDEEKSGTVPFSIKFRGVSRNKMYSITKAIRRAFCETDEVKNIVEEVANVVEDKVNNIVEKVVNEVKTESKRTRRAFCDGQMSEDTADAIVNAVVNEVKNVVVEAVNNVMNVPAEETKEESKKFAENEVNEAVNNAINEVVNNAKNNTEETLEEVENLKNEIKNEVKENVKEEVLDEVTNELDQLVNEAVIEPEVDITTTEDVVNEKSESKKFSAQSSELSKLLFAQFK